MSAAIEFKKRFQVANLKHVYFTHVRFNSAVGIDKVNAKSFEKNLEKHITIISNKVLKGTYVFSQFREKLILRGAERLPRVISIPTIRDKITLKVLFQLLNTIFGSNIPFLHSIIHEVANAVAAGQYYGVLRLDIKDFYPSVRHDFLMIQLSKRIRKKEVLHLIRNAISQQTVSKPEFKKREYNTIGIPQGLSISNILANVYMQPIDKKYKKKTSLLYFRYVDDILILCKQENIAKIKKEIIDDLGKIGLEIHGDNSEKNFSGNISSGFSYLGYVFSASKVTVRKKSIDNLRESILKILTSYKYSSNHSLKLLSWSLNTRITGCVFNGTKYGWLFFFSQMNDLQLLCSLDHFVKKQLVRFGLDPQKIKIKKFIRAYHEINKNLKNSKYIPNFDNITLKEKRKILHNIFGINVKLMGRNEIEYQFSRKIFRTVKELERDLARPS